MAVNQSKWREAADWLDDYWIPVASGVNPVFIGLASYWASDEGSASDGGWRMFAVIALLVFSSAQFGLVIASIRRTDQLTVLRDKNAQLTSEKSLWQTDVKRLIYAYMKHIGTNELEFGSKPGESQRLTVYLHDDSRSVFVPVCRFSNSPAFREVNRAECPDDEGCLAKAWRNGWHYTYDYPDPLQYPQQYDERALKDGISAETLAQLRMRSREYCGSVIWNRQGTKHIAILMLESTYNKYRSDMLRTFMRKEEHGYLSDLMDALLAGGRVDHVTISGNELVSLVSGK